MFNLIDNHAINTLCSAAKDIKSLSCYLVKPARNQIEKARAIFRWITANIEYDVDALFRKSYFHSLNAQSILNSRKGVCAGYSTLFQELARQAGLQVSTISGHGKGYTYLPGNNVRESNHDWNAVCLEDRWQLIDCTWGAGHINESKRYIHEFEDFFFLTPPEQFIYSHFPDDSQWQLLPHPISRTEYKNLIYVYPDFFRLGMDPVQYHSASIEIDNLLIIPLVSRYNVALSARIGSLKKRKDISNTFAQKEGDIYAVRAAFPSSGNFILTIFGRKREDNSPYLSLMSYGVRALKRPSGIVCFPVAYNAFANCGATLIEPFNGYLRKGIMQSFSIKIPGALEAAVECAHSLNHLQKVGEIFSGKVLIRGDKAIVYAKLRAGTEYEGLLQYGVS